MEKVQEKALKIVAGIKAKSYVERCEELGLDTLEKSRKIQDMVETYQILCSKNDCYASGCWRLSESLEEEQGKQQNH
jgi:hypothetical protein